MLVRSILVSKYFGIGSIALQLPLLRALRKQYPGARIVFTTFASNARLLELSRLCDEILTVRTDGALNFAGDCLRTVRRARSIRPDIGIDLEFFSKFAQLMCYFSGASMRIGLERPEQWRRRMYHRMVPITDPQTPVPPIHGFVANNPANEPPNHPQVLKVRWRHILDIYGDIARAAGAESYDDTMVPIDLPQGTIERTHELLRSLGWNDNERIVGVNVNASELVIGRRWPKEQFAVIIDWLVTSTDKSQRGPRRKIASATPRRIVLTGTAAEFEYTESCREILSEHARSRTINGAGLLGLDEFLAFLTMCEILITNDTGPLHLAALMRTRTVSLWGPGAPEMYAPRGPDHASVYERYWCSPCMYLYRIEPGTFCRFTFPCVRQLALKQVKSAVAGLLSQPTKGNIKEQTGVKKGDR
jgi:ADP-heptose:LPS heptosyltransferase